MKEEDIIGTHALAGAHRGPDGKRSDGVEHVDRPLADASVERTRAERDAPSGEVGGTEPWTGSSTPGRALTDLRDLDWNFADAETGGLTHRVHPYPAKFIPQIPRALISRLSTPGQLVGDIFCGSGTTLVEAAVLGRRALGIDANPLACLIARAKTSRPEARRLDDLLELSERARDTAAIVARGGGGFRSAHWRPAFPKLDFWFEPFIVEELAELLSWLRDMPNDAATELGLATFSSIVVAVSRQDSDTRYVRRDKGLAPGDAFKRFARAMEAAIRSAGDYATALHGQPDVTVRQATLLDGPQIPTLDLMVCSPPYPNAYSYHLYHMTRMVWLGMDQPRFRREEIGSHRKYSSPGAGAAGVETFRAEFDRIMSWLSGKLRRGGFACFVVGDSTVRGERIDNAELIARAGANVGFEEAARIGRTMLSSRKSFNPKIGRIKQESILILRNATGAAR